LPNSGSADRVAVCRMHRAFRVIDASGRLWRNDRYKQPAVWAASIADFGEVVFLTIHKKDEGMADSAVPFFFGRRKPRRIGWLCGMKQN